MNNDSQQLKNEIIKKNLILNSFNNEYDSDSDKEQAQNVKVELDNLLYQYYKMKFKE